jgi:hypothetical protein
VAILKVNKHILATGVINGHFWPRQVGRKHRAVLLTSLYQSVSVGLWLHWL